ncbi:MAG TPA: glycosyltransferase [Chitinophagales bacterium]|nr:glycosyltransferase [Chitinophagales bacterium]
MATRKRILVAPLDWGLGHATRCVPLINALVENGCDVTLASSGDALTVLQKHFPSLRSTALPGYNVRYARGASQVVSMLFQFPKLQRAVAAEHAIVNGLVKRERFDGIISDNRYGVYARDIPSVIVTHQLQLMMPRSLQTFQPFVRSLLHRYINRFDACWVPDADGETNLSGALSHNVDLKIPVSFIGPLSRFERIGGNEKNLDVLVLLSGPEPQRTMLEEKLTKQLMPTDLRVTVVRGLPKSDNAKSPRDGFEVIGYADKNTLQHLLSKSKYVIARSGYSSVMDFSAAGAKALLIPTPGQTEQEYLAAFLFNKNYCVTTRQSEPNAVATLDKLDSTNGFPTRLNFNEHRNAIANWLQTI